MHTSCLGELGIHRPTAFILFPTSREGIDTLSGLQQLLQHQVV